jgi:hypothetical protein
VGQQRPFRVPGVPGQMVEQGSAHVRIEVRFGENFADQALELKLQGAAPGGRGRWGIRCGRLSCGWPDQLPPVVSSWG